MFSFHIIGFPTPTTTTTTTTTTPTTTTITTAAVTIIIQMVWVVDFIYKIPLNKIEGGP
jgi:hypothetical protein